VNDADARVLDADGVARSIRRMAASVLDRSRGSQQLGLVGIRGGGLPIARRIAQAIAGFEGRVVPVGHIDITLYRDDAAMADPNPKIGPSAIDFPVDGWDIVLVDDVLHTGRTVRAAIDCLLDFGRPRRIWLAVLCDRGGRELPIAADFVGRAFEVDSSKVLDVLAEGGPDDGVVVRAGHAQRGVR
jgi:pyrimidine operon attenuation protein/uracil phosphoribosyltransferase